MITTITTIKPMKNMHYNIEKQEEREFLEKVILWLSQRNIIRLWNETCERYGWDDTISKYDADCYINDKTGEVAYDLYQIGVDDEYIIDYLLEIIRDGMGSIDMDGTIELLPQQG